jgi:hypothetical protein
MLVQFFPEFIEVAITAEAVAIASDAFLEWGVADFALVHPCRRLARLQEF